MPKTLVVFYKDREGNVPVLEWLDALPAKIQDKCVVKLERLRDLGHELRRPEADLLRNGIYELRVGRERMIPYPLFLSWTNGDGIGSRSYQRAGSSFQGH